eukprot:evm.model.scf_235.14 EVM.evm.TU.scf_235.14   scf_235:106642-108216(-)
MPPETYLAKKLRELGLSSDGGSAHKRVQFRLYFPRPPYGDVEYTAARHADGLNFVGQLLGHGGATLQQIQRESGARIEVHDSRGNLNGNHPDCSDCSVHALLFADSRDKLAKAARMIADIVAPVNASFERFEVTAGGLAVLRPKVARERATRGGSSAWAGLRKSVSATTGTVESMLPATQSWDGAMSAVAPPPPTPVPGKSWAAVLRPKEAENPSAAENESEANPSAARGGQGAGLDGGVRRGKLGPGGTDVISDGSSETLSEAKSAELAEQTSGCVSEDGGQAGEAPLGRGWDTWGRDSAEPYNQFTSATQSLVTDLANRSRAMKQQAAAMRQAAYAEALRGAREGGAGLCRPGCELGGQPGGAFLMPPSLHEPGGGRLGSLQMSQAQIADPFAQRGVASGAYGGLQGKAYGGAHAAGGQHAGSNVGLPVVGQSAGSNFGLPTGGQNAGSNFGLPAGGQNAGSNFGLPAGGQNAGSKFGLSGVAALLPDSLPGMEWPNSDDPLDQGQREEVNQFVNLLKVPLP